MKLIAHRGASLERPENTLESITYAAQLGADAVECDVRTTADGVYVIFHDSDLARFSNLDKRVDEVSCAEMKAILARSGKELLTLEALIENYREKAPILFHIKLHNPGEDLVVILKKADFELICGVQSIQALKTVHKVFPSDHILAFAPRKEHHPEFAEKGAGIIRLWEHWLEDLTPDMVRQEHNVKVWVMASKNGSMNGSIESLDTVHRLGADGMLLNDIVLALRWKKGLLSA